MKKYSVDSYYNKDNKLYTKERKNSNNSYNSYNSYQAKDRKCSGFNTSNYKDNYENTRKYSNPGYSNRYNNKGYMYGYKRYRFNSDNEYNHKKFGSFNEDEIEIDLSNVKYSLDIKYKYSFKNIQDIYNKLIQENKLNDLPNFITPNLDDIYIKDSSQRKDIKVLNDLINEFDIKDDIKNDCLNINSDIGVPKFNPLSTLPVTFNKFDYMNWNNTLNQKNTYTPLSIENSSKFVFQKSTEKLKEQENK